LSIEATIVGPSTWVILEEAEFEDFFCLALSQNLFNFPILTNKERQLMEAVVSGRKDLRETGL
jgi:hypothetical protein